MQKKRLVGAFVIIMLLVILVPAWLDGSARRLRDEEAFSVPLPPPDNRQQLADTDDIGRSLDVEVPKLVPLPKVIEPVERVVESVEPAVQESVAEVQQVVKKPAPKPAPKPQPVKKPKAAPAPAKKTERALAPVEVDLETGERRPATPSAPVPAAVSRANWIVQVGSFASRKNAEKMVARLKKGGLKALMREFDSNGDSIYRVLVGPFVRQTEADDAKRTIDRNFKVKSFVANWRG